DPAHFVAQPLNVSQMGGVPAVANAAAEGQPQLKDLVDAWGNPILLWAQDERAVQQVKSVDDFARIDSSGGPARFYWNSNACFLESKTLGKRGYDQQANSALSINGNTAPVVQQSLMGLVGSPSFSVQVATPPLYLPTQGRSSFLLQSAGRDGV